ncbi:hypothetical protein [Kitasatospora griseola]|uniref:hypothetical protein n=1 Tax=Kitasatospora griseola TaxID=2064 RepID=UPI0036516C78
MTGPEPLPARPGADRPPRAPRRAATFAKPAHALMTGDYLQIHAHRHPAADMGVDEGFRRVEAVRHFPAARAPARPRARAPRQPGPARAGGGLVLAAVHGVHGTLLLTGTHITVLIAPNPERHRYNETDPWTGGAVHDLTGATVPDPTSSSGPTGCCGPRRRWGRGRCTRAGSPTRTTWPCT